MKQNVVLFSILAIGAVYIWYETQEKQISKEEMEIKSSSPDPDEKLKPNRHSRKLLFHKRTESEPEDIDISTTSIDKYRNSSLETRFDKTPRIFRERGKKSSRRRKRRVQNSREQLAWKFNLNVTRYENKTPKNKTEYPTERKDTDTKSKKDKYLGMSLSVAGNGPDQSLEELYQAWDSVGQFLRSLFGGNLEELKEKGHGVSVDIDPLPNGTKDMPLEFFMEGSGDEEFQAKKREGKFILGLFGFGGNNENPPRDEGSGETLDIQDFNGTEVLLDIQSKNNTHGITDSSTEFEVTVNSIEISSVSAIVTTDVPSSKESVTSRSTLKEIPLTINPTNINITPNIPISEEAFLEGNCTDCEIKTVNVSTDGIGFIEESSTSFVPVVNSTKEFPFNAEALADFCNALFTRLQKSTRSVERSVGNEGSGSFATDESDVAMNSQASNILTDEPRPQNFGFLERIWNRIMGRKSVPVQEDMDETRGARLINVGDLFEGLGSGRSDELGISSNFEFDNFQAGVTESDEDIEQFLSDCEAFLMSVQTDTRPNIFDLIHPHPEENVPTEFTTLKSGKSQLSEHETVTNFTFGEKDSNFESTSQSEGLTVLPMIIETDHRTTAKDELLNKSPSEVQFTTEVQDKRLLQENDQEKPLESSTKTENSFFTEVQEKNQSDSFNVRNLVEETMNISLEFVSTELSNLSFFTNMDANELSTEEINGTNLNDQRSFNLFGFGGSGAEEVSDEGSADASKLNERVFGLFNFGSGDREFKENDILSMNTTENFKERSLFPSFGSGGRELGFINNSEWEFEEDPKSSTESRGRFFGFGSGERELKETLETTTDKSEVKSVLYLPEESIVATHNKFPEESPSVAPEKLNVNLKATLTPNESSETYTETQKSSKDSTTTECDDAQEDILAPISHFGGMFSSTSISSRTENTDKENEFKSTTVMVQPSFLDNRENLEYKKDGSTEEPSETTTLKNDPRLIGTIFLTGSGEGGLFVDNKGPINLVQESEFTSPVFEKPPQSGRGARRHDSEIQIRRREQIERNFEVTEPVQFTDAKSFFTTQETTGMNNMSTSANEAFDETTGMNNMSTSASEAFDETTGINDMSTSANEAFDETTGMNDMSTSANEAFDETTVLFETIVENATVDVTTFEPEIMDETVTSTISLVTSKSVTELAVTTSRVIITSTSAKITPRTKVLKFPKKLCSSASECNRTLNERCISTGTTSVCNCGRSYVRSPETGKCESPVVLKTSLKLPGEVFHKDLKNRNSERFQKKRNESIETMMLLLGDDPDLFRTIAGVEVSGFEEGSLVVHWEITLAPNDTTIPSLIEQVDSDLKEAFEDEALLEKTPLNVTNAVLMAVTSDMDPCEKTERNYCSKNADCIPDPLRGFLCRCKDDYVDKSMDAGHPGEVCIASCPPYYCGDHGECNLKEDGNRHCSCNGWFFGEQCEISGIIVIAGFASFNVVLIIVVVVLVCVCRKRRYRQSRFYGQNQVRFQPGTELGLFTASPRLADTLAMDDVGHTKTKKYLAISTPLHNAPTIQIRSPSVIGSSVDYDYESTFDRTPSAGETSVEVQKTEESHQI